MLLVLLFSQIHNQSVSLVSDSDTQTLTNIEGWVDDNFDYEYNKYPKSLSKYWYSKKGDCTEKAMLLKIMLSNVNITTRYSHGYLNGQKHDSLDVYINNSWYTLDIYNKTGLGRW